MEAKKRQLDQLGFIWDPIPDVWEKGYQYLQAFVKKEGHCNVPIGIITKDGFKLGRWVSTQRYNYNKNKILNKHIKCLESIGFNWDPFSEQWEKGFEYLKAFVKKEGHCKVPKEYKTEDGFNLGGWVSRQRCKKDKILKERRNRLESLGFY